MQSTWSRLIITKPAQIRWPRPSLERHGCCPWCWTARRSLCCCCSSEKQSSFSPPPLLFLIHACVSSLCSNSHYLIWIPAAPVQIWNNGSPGKSSICGFDPVVTGSLRLMKAVHTATRCLQLSQSAVSLPCLSAIWGGRFFQLYSTHTFGWGRRFKNNFPTEINNVRASLRF